MRKALFAILFAASLGGCATTSSPSGVIVEIQNSAKAICGFVPAASVVAQLVGQGEIVGVLAIAQAICNAVTPAKLAARKGHHVVPKVNGIAIKGRFVR